MSDYPLATMRYERGVAGALRDVGGRHGGGSRDPRRPLLAYSHLLRLVLDHAGTVAEAVESIGRYAWEHAGGDHLMVADASGDAAIVEFLGNRVAAVGAGRGWQVATNTSVTGRSPEQLRAGVLAATTPRGTLAATAGTTSPEQAMAPLARIAMDGTLVTASSSVFNLSTREWRTWWSAAAGPRCTASRFLVCNNAVPGTQFAITRCQVPNPPVPRSSADVGPALRAGFVVEAGPCRRQWRWNALPTIFQPSSNLYRIR